MNVTLKFDAEYASEVMNEIPAGYIDKTICGCGLTTVALENLVHTVIAVPTIYLAQNKAAQYPNERFAGKVLAVWGETSKFEIEDYVKNTDWLKIIVTYDSLPKVEYLLDTYKCKLIIDESNELLSRTKLRPEAIHKLFEIAKKYRKTVSFISATPTPLEYMPDWVKKLKQIKIEWANSTKTIPILCKSTYPFKSLNHQFLTPLNENGFLTINGNNNECITIKRQSFLSIQLIKHQKS